MTNRLRTARLFAGCAALVAGTSLVPSATASAHYSSWCGHGSSTEGLTTVVKYDSNGSYWHYLGSSLVHHHETVHVRTYRETFLHSAQLECAS